MSDPFHSGTTSMLLQREYYNAVSIITRHPTSRMSGAGNLRVPPNMDLDCHPVSSQFVYPAQKSDHVLRNL
jgi:hypothetical protein